MTHCCSRAPVELLDLVVRLDAAEVSAHDLGDALGVVRRRLLRLVVVQPAEVGVEQRLLQQLAQRLLDADLRLVVDARVAADAVECLPLPHRNTHIVTVNSSCHSFTQGPTHKQTPVGSTISTSD